MPSHVLKRESRQPVSRRSSVTLTTSATSWRLCLSRTNATTTTREECHTTAPLSLFLDNRAFAILSLRLDGDLPRLKLYFLFCRIVLFVFPTIPRRKMQIPPCFFCSSPRNGKILPNFDSFLPKFHFILPKNFSVPRWSMFISYGAVGKRLRGYCCL